MMAPRPYTSSQAPQSKALPVQSLPDLPCSPASLRTLSEVSHFP